jgi:hypothetical protein
MTATTTVDQTGTKSISLKSTGNEKAHVTVVLAAKADGTKLRPYVVFKKGIREVTKLQQTVNWAVVRSSSNGWMNDQLTADWLKQVFHPFAFGRRMLVWDSYKCHISESTKTALRTYNSTVAVVPGGCTKYIQPADVSWNKAFKAKMTEYYGQWMAGDQDKELTRGGNLKAPSKLLMLKWIREAWNSLDKEIILKSFKACGISTAFDGSEDSLIQCMRNGNPCEGALQLLKEARLNIALQDLSIGPDEEEDEHNEILTDSDDEDPETNSDDDEDNSESEDSDD